MRRKLQCRTQSVSQVNCYRFELIIFRAIRIKSMGSQKCYKIVYWISFYLLNLCIGESCLYATTWIVSFFTDILTIRLQTICPYEILCWPKYVKNEFLYCKCDTERVVKKVAALLHVREVASSCFGPKTGYPYWGFSGFPAPFRKIPGYLKLGHDRFFTYHFHFSIYSTVLFYITWDADYFVK
jgi:hypothetical protein